MKRRRDAMSAAGFTLVELMVVVGILGVLSSLAVISYVRYAQRAHVSEAYGMLGMIRMRQESYYSEFTQYCDIAGNNGTTGGLGSYFPDSAPGRRPVAWSGDATLQGRWRMLGVNPSGSVYYRYDSPAGNPNVAPAWGGGLNYSASTEHPAWWAAHAYGNLDGDSIVSTFEAFSLSNNGRIWVSPDESE